MIENMIKSIPGIVPNFCDRCGSRYIKADLEVLNTNQEGFTCRIMCKNCGNIHLVQVSASMEGINARKLSVFSDFRSTKEIKSFTGSTRISAAEVLDVMHAMQKIKKLKDFWEILTNTSKE